MTDVNLSVNRKMDAPNDSSAMAALISADSDLVPPTKAIRNEFPSKQLISLFPPDRNSFELRTEANHTLFLECSIIKKVSFPNM